MSTTPKRKLPAMLHEGVDHDRLTRKHGDHAVRGLVGDLVGRVRRPHGNAPLKSGDESRALQVKRGYLLRAVIRLAS